LQGRLPEWLNVAAAKNVPFLDIISRLGEPSNCMAYNSLPYTTVEFDPKNFPANTWMLVPCEKHSALFESYPDSVT